MALRFLNKGFSKKKTLTVIMAWTLFFVIDGLIMSKAANFFASVMLVSAGLGGFILFKKMSRVQI
jgi:hypothetical protein